MQSTASHQFGLFCSPTTAIKMFYYCSANRQKNRRINVTKRWFKMFFDQKYKLFVLQQHFAKKIGRHLLLLNNDILLLIGIYLNRKKCKMTCYQPGIYMHILFLLKNYLYCTCSCTSRPCSLSSFTVFYLFYMQINYFNEQEDIDIRTTYLEYTRHSLIFYFK